MIDIGLSKLALIGAVALIVIGPEKLPRVARTVGTLLGKAQRYVADVKSEVNRSMELDELKKMKEAMEGAARDVEQSIQTNASAFEKDMNHAAGLGFDGDVHSSASHSHDDFADLYNVVPAYRHPGKNWRLIAARCRSGTSRAAACAPKSSLAPPAWRATGPKNPINSLDADAFCAAPADVRSAALEHVRYLS